MRARAVLLIALGLVACSSSSPPTAPPSSDVETFETSDFTLQAGEEKFLCFAKTLDHDLVVDKFEYAARPGVHHAILSRTLAKEPEGFSECRVLLRTTWVPVFASATGDARLDIPQGAGVVLPKGTQLVVQLHLLNANKTPLTGRYAVSMRKSPLKAPEPIGIYAFGTTGLVVPPKSTSTQTDSCTVPEEIDVFAIIPHMHYRGRSMRFEAGPSDAEMKEIHRIDKYDFEKQIIEPKAFKLPKGTKTRVSCTFDNELDRELGFGESSNDEMCFFVTFARNREGMSGCSGSSGGAGTNPACGTKPENALGVGKKCTKGGKECPSGLLCTLDQGSAPEGSPGFCFKLGCNETGECGGGDAVCCAPKQAGGAIKVCMPESCRPSDCAL